MGNKKIKSVKMVLENLQANHRPFYEDLFLRRKSIADSAYRDNYDLSNMLDILSENSIIKRKNNFKSTIESKYLIYPVRNCFILTDFHSVREIDRIFPIFHENVFLSSILKIPKGGKVLDIGFGSGIFSIVSIVNGASEVYASDINPKAVRYAEMNSIINDVEDNTHFLLGNVYDPLPKGVKFDLICTNPPFLPMPTNIPYYVHSNGGFTGTDVIEKIFKVLPDWITPEGFFQMIAMSLGNAKEPLIMPLLHDILGKQDASIEITILQEPLMRYDYIMNLKQKVPFAYDERDFTSWDIRLQKEGITHFYYYYVEVTFGRPFSVKIKKDYTEADRIKSLLNEQFGPLNGIQWKNHDKMVELKLVSEVA
jgi:methylase of polypeptide subunit release factors